MENQTAAYVRPPPKKAPELDLAAPFLSVASRFGPLSAQSQELVRGLEVLGDFRPSQTVRLPAWSARDALIGAGWAARYRLLSDGRRQIISLLLPGDLVLVDEHEAQDAKLPLTMLTRVRILNARPLRAAADGGVPHHAALAKAVSHSRAEAGARLVDHVVRLGAQNGLERMAHLLIELHGRMTAAGLTDRDDFHMPMTQECLADMLGLSIVHVNRTLQRLRQDDLISLSHGRLTILQPETLRSMSE